MALFTPVWKGFLPYRPDDVLLHVGKQLFGSLVQPAVQRGENSDGGVKCFVGDDPRIVRI